MFHLATRRIYLYDTTEKLFLEFSNSLKNVVETTILIGFWQIDVLHAQNRHYSNTTVVHKRKQ